MFVVGVRGNFRAEFLRVSRCIVAIILLAVRGFAWDVVWLSSSVSLVTTSFVFLLVDFKFVSVDETSILVTPTPTVT